MRKARFTLGFCLIVTLQISAQNFSFSFGNNATHFSDWERTFNCFNPEILFIKKVQRNCILVSVDGFYGKKPTKQISETGEVYDRLIFTLKCDYAFKLKNLLLGIGPAARYRNEKPVLNNPPFYDYVGKRNQEYIDLGLNSSVLYMFNTRKNSILFKLSYSAFNGGKSPLSFGIFYGWGRIK